VHQGNQLFDSPPSAPVEVPSPNATELPRILIEDNSNLTSVILTSVVEATAVVIRNNAELTEIDFPSLQNLAVDIVSSITENPLLTLVSMPSLTTGFISITKNKQLQSVDFPSWQSGTRFAVARNGPLDDVAATSFVEAALVEDSELVSIQNNSEITSFSLRRRF